MKKKITDIIKQKDEELVRLASESNEIQERVVVAINSLSLVNDEIDDTLKEINKIKNSLFATEQELFNVKAKNEKSINNYIDLFEK